MSEFWWNADEERAHERVFEKVRALEEVNKAVHQMNLANARLYSNTDMLGLDWTIDAGSYDRRSLARVTENVIQSVCDTTTSMIAKNRPRAKFLTDGGDFSTQQRARQLDRFTEGLFQWSDIYHKGPKVFRDSTVFGTGAFKVVDTDGHPDVERVIIDEIIVDELECRSAPPRQLFQRKFVDREVLKELYPDHADAIDNAHRDTRKYTSTRRIDSHQVVVVEAWHLPSSRGAGDGRTAICVDGVTLKWAPYTKDDFPFVFLRWSEPLCGFYGQGLAEQLCGIQLRINKLNRFIERCHDLVAAPRVFVELGSKVNRDHFTNEIGSFVYYRGRPPTIVTPQAVGAEIYAYKEQLKRSAFEFAGVSQLSAQSKKPGGLESAVALREFNDIETQRFAIQAQAYEQAFISVAYKMIDLARELYGKGQKFKSVFSAGSFTQSIDWNDVDLDEDRFVITVEAASIMSRTPAGRLQAVIELAQAGVIDTDESRRLLGHPDIEHSRSLYNAAIEYIERVIEQINRGVYVPPEPFENLQLSLKRIQLAYLKACELGAPEDIRELYRQRLEQTQFLLKPPAPPSAPMTTGAPPPEAMGGGAMPPPGMAPPGMTPAMPPQAALAAQAQQLQPM